MSDVDPLPVRACTAGDIEAVLALVRADEERVNGRPSRLVQGDVRDWWQSIDLAANSWLVMSPESAAPVAVVWFDRQGTDLGIGFPIAAAAHRGSLSLLVDLVERRSAGRVQPAGGHPRGGLGVPRDDLGGIRGPLGAPPPAVRGVVAPADQ